MNRPSYILARSTARPVEPFFHRYNLATRLTALAAGGELRLTTAMVTRFQGHEGGPCVRVSVVEPGGDEHFLAYVARAGVDILELKEALQRALDDEACRQERRAA